MFRWWRQQPFLVTKIGQMWRAVRESHEAPILGSTQPPELVMDEELGVTFIGHSSFVAGAVTAIRPVPDDIGLWPRGPAARKLAARLSSSGGLRKRKIRVWPR